MEKYIWIRKIRALSNSKVPAKDMEVLVRNIRDIKGVEGVSFSSEEGLVKVIGEFNPSDIYSKITSRGYTIHKLI